MNLLKLNKVAVSAVAIMVIGTTSAAAKDIITSTAAPLVKRGILLSVGAAKPSTGEISNNLEAEGYADAQVTGASNAKTFAIGYRQPLGKNLSVDMTYIDQGEISARVRAAPSGSVDSAKDVALALPIYGNGLNYAGLRHFSVSRGVSAHVGAGVFIYTNEREATIDGDQHVETDRGVSPMVQLGLNLAVTPRVKVELVGQRFFMSGEDVDRLSVGLSVGF